MTDPYARGLTLTADMLPPEETLADVVEQIGQAEKPLSLGSFGAPHAGTGKGDGARRWVVSWRGKTGPMSRQVRAISEFQAHERVSEMPNAGPVPPFAECHVRPWVNSAACPRVRARREALAIESAPTERTPARLIPPSRAERRGMRE